MHHVFSAWAIYCKKIINPAKKSGCGWASIKYKVNYLTVLGIYYQI